MGFLFYINLHHSWLEINITSPTNRLSRIYFCDRAKKRTLLTEAHNNLDVYN